MLIETVRGPVEASALGRTYMHEHIFTLTPDVQLNYPDEWGDEDARIADAVYKLKSIASAGIDTIVDLTVVGLGRFIPRIQRVAEKVPELNIIVATGIYTYDEVPAFFKYRLPKKGQPDPMVEMFVRDIKTGIADTGVKAGMLKCAIDKKGLTPGVERVMRAIGQAHLQTHAPITVHSYPKSKTGLDVLRVLCEEEGVSPSRIVLAHSGDSTDCDHLMELADHGFILGMDRFGIYAGISFEERANTVIELCRRGYAQSMVLSHDACCYIDWMDEATKCSLHHWHYAHILEDVLPYLLNNGVTQSQVDAMMVHTPCGFFTNTLAR